MICPFMSSKNEKQDCIRECALFCTYSNGCAIQSIASDCSSISDDTDDIEKIADVILKRGSQS